eukprot:SAG11_NODE_2117_length_3792_cov_2.955321_4_plen_131_part_00
MRPRGSCRAPATVPSSVPTMLSRAEDLTFDTCKAQNACIGKCAQCVLANLNGTPTYCHAVHCPRILRELHRRLCSDGESREALTVRVETAALGTLFYTTFTRPIKFSIGCIKCHRSACHLLDREPKTDFF